MKIKRNNRRLPVEWVLLKSIKKNTPKTGKNTFAIIISGLTNQQKRLFIKKLFKDNPNLSFCGDDSPPFRSVKLVENYLDEITILIVKSHCLYTDTSHYLYTDTKGNFLDGDLWEFVHNYPTPELQDMQKWHNVLDYFVFLESRDLDL